MPATQKALLLALITIACLAFIALASTGSTAGTGSESMIDWASTECSQGNSDACALELNLLKR